MIVDPMQPAFETPPTAYTTENILCILLDPNINPDEICQERSTNVTHSAIYVMDIKAAPSR